MKKLFLISTIILLTVGGCKCTKKTAANNMQPKFEAQEEWELVSIRGKKVSYEEGQTPVTIFFNPEAETMGGRSGCNRYFGSYKNSTDGHLSFGEIGGTKMACPEPFMKLERQYLQTLNKVDHYDLGEYQLILLQGETELLKFDKAEPKENK